MMVVAVKEARANGFAATSRRCSVDSAVFDYAYDAQNRLAQVKQSEAASGTHNDVLDKRVDFTYNLAGQFDTINRYSDLAGTALVAGSVYSYDDAGRLARIQHDRGGSWVAHAYSYDDNDRVTRYENLIPTGNWDDAVDYTYDDTNQLVEEDTWNSYQDNA
jgi:YD repeat-containing protein